MAFSGKVALITGGGSGIGEALAERFHAEGARGLVVLDRDGVNAERVAQNVDGRAVALDVTDEAAIAAVVAETVDQQGTGDLIEPLAEAPRVLGEFRGIVRDRIGGY